MSLSTRSSNYIVSTQSSKAYPFLQRVIRPQVIGSAFTYKVRLLQPVRHDMDRVVGGGLVRKVVVLFTQAGGGAASEVEGATEEKYDEQGEDTLEDTHRWVLLLTFLVLTTTCSSVNILLPSVEPTGATWEEHPSLPTEEHAENVVRVELVLPELLCVPLREIFFRAMLIIDPSLLWVVETGEGRADFLESISSIGSPVFIGVKLQCQFLVGFLEILLCGALRQSQNFIVIFLRNHGLATSDLKV